MGRVSVGRVGFLSPSPLILRSLPQAILDIVVDDEIQFLVRKAIVVSQHLVALVNNWLGKLRVKPPS